MGWMEGCFLFICSALVLLDNVWMESFSFARNTFRWKTSLLQHHPECGMCACVCIWRRGHMREAARSPKLEIFSFSPGLRISHICWIFSVENSFKFFWLKYILGRKWPRCGASGGECLFRLCAGHQWPSSSLPWNPPYKIQFQYKGHQRLKVQCG